MTPTTPSEQPPVPGIRPKAPEPLEVVQDFVNTNWLRTGEEHLGDPRSLDSWLSDHALFDSTSHPTPTRKPANDADLELALRLRTSLKRMLARASQPSASPAEPQAEAGEFPDLPVLISLGANGHTHARPAATGVPGSLAWILIAAWDGERSGRLERLKLCAAPDCGWAYYDPSRNKSATWWQHGSLWLAREVPLVLPAAEVPGVVASMRGTASRFGCGGRPASHALHVSADLTRHSWSKHCNTRPTHRDRLSRAQARPRTRRRGHRARRRGHRVKLVRGR